MSIRLSKACKDLNVGMHTAVEFLAKKGHKLALDPNLKLDDDLHLLLAKEFNKDMALKIESERLSQERLLKEKAPTVAIEGYNQPKPVEKKIETIPVFVPEDKLPQFKQVGQIDLTPKRPAPKPVEKVQPPVAEAPKPIEKVENKAPEAPKTVEKVIEESKKETIPVPITIAHTIEKLVEELKAEFGCDYAFQIVGHGKFVAASNYKDGVIKPTIKA